MASILSRPQWVERSILVDASSVYIGYESYESYFHKSMQ